MASSVHRRPRRHNRRHSAYTDSFDRSARNRFGGLIRDRINADGKTGTAQHTIPEIDPQTGRAKTYIDRAGKTLVKMAEKPRIDSWFIGFAPVENRQPAWAVVVEERRVRLANFRADCGAIAA